MSGTSFDGVDVALIKTDGYDYAEEVCSAFIEYTKEEKNLYHFSLFQNLNKLKEIIDQKHIQCIEKLLKEINFDSKNIDVIGVHGQTFAHNPEERWSWQYINVNKIVQKFQIKVVSELRLKDINFGGEGAPLVPIYHNLLCKRARVKLPIVVLNIGGVTNATIINKNNSFIGFDIGPGNGPLDSIVFEKLKINMDVDGNIASKGKASKVIASEIINNFYNSIKTNSFDRNKLDKLCLEGVRKLNCNDALATITLVICNIILSKIKPYNPKKIILVGGGRKNIFLVKSLIQMFMCPVILAEDIGWDGDSLEAQAFAYLAVRSLLGLYITNKETTGVFKPLSGGVLHNII